MYVTKGVHSRDRDSTTEHSRRSFQRHSWLRTAHPSFRAPRGEMRGYPRIFTIFFSLPPVALDQNIRWMDKWRLVNRDEVREQWKPRMWRNRNRNHLLSCRKNVFDRSGQFTEIVAKLLLYARKNPARARARARSSTREMFLDLESPWHNERCKSTHWIEERKLLFAIRCYFIQLVPGQTVVLVLQASYVNKSRMRTNRVPARWFSASLRAWSRGLIMLCGHVFDIIVIIPSLLYTVPRVIAANRDPHQRARNRASIALLWATNGEAWKICVFA